MKWLLGSLFALALALFVTGMVWEEKASGSEERAGAMLPYVLGAIILAIDVLTFIGWVIWRLS